LFDLDSHKGETSFAEMIAIADRLCARLDSIGLRPVVFRSSGGAGLHIWLLWDAPQDAYSMRQALQGVLTAEGLRDGAGAGIAGGQVEIFPKQNALTISQTGSMVVLPLWNKSEMLKDEFGLGLYPAGRAAVIGFAWPMSDAVPYLVNTAPERVQGTAASPDGPDKVARALGAIPNATGGGTNGATNHDEWRNLLFATHEASAGQEWGFDRFNAWTNQNPGNAGQRETRRVWDACKPGLITRGTLYAMASRCNPDWDVPTADGFEDIPVEDAVTPVAPGLIDMTDTGNVNVLHSVTTGTLRYIHESGVWLHWCGKRWTSDPSAIHANSAALRVAADYLAKAQKMQFNANDATAPADRKSLQKVADSFKSWSNYCRNKRGIDAMLALSTRDIRFVISQADLDKDIYLFGVNNGVVDLRTGKLRDTARDDLITKRSPYDYVPTAQAPRFKRFLDEIFSFPVDDGRTTGLFQYTPRPDLVRYAQMFAGYCMTGSTVEHKMFIASGSGANGKNMFLDLLGDVMGDYAGTVPVESLMASSRGSDDAERPTPFARSVAGKRFIVTSESKEGQKLDTALVKRVTGDSKLTARGMRENAFTFTTTHKIALLTNHPPELDHADEAIKGRLHITPYSRKWNRPGLPSRDPRLHDGDKNLGDKLRAEASGVLSWLVQGAAMYLVEGLEPPPAVADMTNTYFAEQDSFARWLADMEVCPVAEGQTAGTLFESFRAWCGLNSAAFSPATLKAFANAASARGVQRLKSRNGIVYALRENRSELF
jgi:P4 family phage/plasmid primase-like protien